MGWVWDQEASFVPQNLVEEMEGIGEGMCHTLGGSCNATEWGQKVKEVNMLPELIRMVNYCCFFPRFLKNVYSIAF